MMTDEEQRNEETAQRKDDEREIKKRRFTIVPASYLSDVKTERQILEYNRERLALYLVLAGAIVTILAIIW